MKSQNLPSATRDQIDLDSGDLAAKDPNVMGGGVVNDLLAQLECTLNYRVVNGARDNVLDFWHFLNSPTCGLSARLL